MWREVTTCLFSSNQEGCVILFANQVRRPENGTRLLVQQIVTPNESDYTRRGPYEAELAPPFVASIASASKKSSRAIVFVHNHIGEAIPRFSSIDDYGELRLSEFLVKRCNDRMHLALVVGTDGLRCRLLGSDQQVQVVSLDSNRTVLSESNVSGAISTHIYDRQLSVFGIDGQNRIANLTAAVVGLGGTGSVIAQQLTHLGVQSFILIDPDTIETTNLNRVASATLSDIGKAKTSVAARYIRAFSPDARIKEIKGDVIRARNGKALLDADVIFCCTDSHGSRSVLEQVSYQYLLPMIDMGSVITVLDGAVKQIVGRVQMLSPGLACLTCSGLLDPSQVRRDMMTAFERQSDPYIQGIHEPAPAVISLNATIASLSITMLMSAITGLEAKARHIVYLGLSSTMRVISTTPVSGCIVCSPEGRLARGDSWPFPGRQD